MSKSRAKKNEPFIRKQPLSEKIKSYPFDLLLWLHEARLSIDWDDYGKSIGIPSGLGFTTLYTLLIKVSDYYSASTNRRENRLFSTDFQHYEQLKRRAVKGGQSGSGSGDEYNRTSSSHNGTTSLLFSLINLLALGLFVSSCVNFIIVFFTSYKKYSLLNSTPSIRPNTPSATPLCLNNTNEFENSLWFKLNKFVMNHIYGSAPASAFASSTDNHDYNNESFCDDDDESIDEINLVEKNIWQLRVWSPGKFPLFLFVTFSPITLILLKFLSSNTSLLKLISTVIPLISSLNYLLVSRFLILIDDKQILYKEMFGEYNTKFVIPKTSVLKKNAIVDATYGPTVPAQYTVNHDKKAHLQTDKSKVFITHDINGKPFNNVTVKSTSNLLHSKLHPSQQQPVDEYQRLQMLEAKLNMEKEQLQREKQLMLQDRHDYYSDRSFSPRSTSKHPNRSNHGSMSLAELYDLSQRRYNDDIDHNEDEEDEDEEDLHPTWISRSTPYIPSRSQALSTSARHSPWADRHHSITSGSAAASYRSPSRLDRLDSYHKPDLSPNKFTPSSIHRAFRSSQSPSSRTPSPHKNLHDKKSFRSPSPVKYENEDSYASSIKSLSPSRRALSPFKYSELDGAGQSLPRRPL